MTSKPQLGTTQLFSVELTGAGDGNDVNFYVEAMSFADAIAKAERFATERQWDLKVVSVDLINNYFIR